MVDRRPRRQLPESGLGPPGRFLEEADDRPPHGRSRNASFWPKRSLAAAERGVTDRHADGVLSPGSGQSTRPDRFGVIRFAVGANVTREFRQAVQEVEPEGWKPLVRRVGKRLVETGQEWAEVCYVPEASAGKKDGPTYPIRYWFSNVPGRLVQHARQLTLRLGHGHRSARLLLEARRTLADLAGDPAG